MSQQHQPVVPPREAWQRPVRLEPVPGTPYGLAIFGPPSVTSGPAVGALVAGVAAIFVSFAVTCFGLAGARDGWGALVAGAFAVLAGFLAVTGLGLGAVGLRQTQRSALPAGGSAATGVRSAPAAAIGGRGLAVAGLICGATGLALTLISLATALAIQLSSP